MDHLKCGDGGLLEGMGSGCSDASTVHAALLPPPPHHHCDDQDDEQPPLACDDEELAQADEADQLVELPLPAAACGRGAAASPATESQLALQPLPPPEAAEGPGAAAEYQHYLARWAAGDTLAQRWHRLASRGLLPGIQAEWEDGQLDAMLQDLKHGKGTSRAAAGWAAPPTAAGGSNRQRRSRAEVLEGAAGRPAPAEARRVRSRRAPSTLQDYHTPRPDGTPTPEPPASGGGQGPADQQQPGPLHQQAAYPPELLQEAYEVGARLGAALLKQQQQQAAQGNTVGSPHVALSAPAVMHAVMQALRQVGNGTRLAALAQQQQPR